MGWEDFPITALVLFIVIRFFVGVWKLALKDVAVFGLLACVFLILMRRPIMGLLDVLLVPRRQMDITIEECEDGTSAAGILLGKERWYLFLDGITDIRRYREDVWTIHHFNGSMLHIPVSAITQELMDYLEKAMQRGRTPEGFASVIERGRRIREIMRNSENK